ncbi:MAG TPA: exodeoxyribonuclease VII small subunit [Fulvivirga sp.]|nr:exodeoxyribonuclease VII small subunit [Fulvivirga sp.]
MKKNKNSYTATVNELEEIISKIESGELNVDELTEMVKKASDLVQQCQKMLRSTEDDLNKKLGELD